MKTVKAGIIGIGSVGQGVVSVLAANADIIGIRAAEIKLIRAVDLHTEKTQSFIDSLGLEGVTVSGDWRDIANDPDIEIMIETAGGIEMAKEAITAALNNKKTVVTANKDLMAAFGGELLHIAEANGTDLFFEASVAGGIPIIQTMKESLAGNKIRQVMGIVNGTTNYILTQMTENGADFEAALVEAQGLGYAESDPTNDVEGYDAARKMAILSSIAFNMRVKDNMVPVEGITKISSWDITYARELGYVIKMLGLAMEVDNEVEVRVHPTMIPLDHPLASVRDSYNAIFVDAFPLDKAMFYGRGAGGFPTASAVIGDVVNAARNILHNARGRWGCTCFLTKKVKSLAETKSKYYLRIAVNDRIGVFAGITNGLAACNISMDFVIQKRRLSKNSAEIVIITHKVAHSDMTAALAAISALDYVVNIENVIRVED